jgi:hypothetical protein
MPEGEDVMRRITLLGLGLLTLGSARAMADPMTDPPSATDTVPPPLVDPGPTPAPGPKTTVTAPPGSKTTIETPKNGDGTTLSVPTPEGSASGDTAVAPPVTNVEINEPPPQNNTVVVPPPVQPLAPPPPAYAPPHREVVGAGMLVGGGVQDFTRSSIRDMTGTGGYWNARLLFGSRNIVGFEAAYIGSAQSIDALGLSSDATLVSNGAEGALRLNMPIVHRRSLMEPFVFGGAGWSHYHVANSTTNASSVNSNDDILEVPYGAGFAMGYGGFMADARFTYRSTFYNDLLKTTGGRLDNWSAGGQVGFEF